MKQSIKECVAEYKEVLRTRRSLQELFNNIVPCKITIAGSYALKWQCAAFRDRVISDYDFVLHVPETDDSIKIKRFLCLLQQHVPYDTVAYSNYHSFHFGKCLDLPVNIILSEEEAGSSLFDPIERIIEVKKEWQRPKDIKDIETYEAWKEEDRL
jgi:hypothetical protein